MWKHTNTTSNNGIPWTALCAAADTERSRHKTRCSFWGEIQNMSVEPKDGQHP